MIKHLLLILPLLFASCSKVNNTPYIVLNSQQEQVSEPPGHFVVTVEEIKKAIPFTKYHWTVFADHENYLLFPSGIRKTQSKTAVKSSSIKISGIKRTQIERVLKILSSRNHILVEQLSQISKNN